MRYACQVILVLLWTFSLLMSLYADVNGKPAAVEPKGFGGVVTTLIAFAISLTLWWHAGALSGFFQ